MEQTFGSRLRQRRKKLGMSQQELAIASGISRLTISQFENNVERNMHANTIQDLAAALKTTPEVLRPEPAYRDIFDGPERPERPLVVSKSVGPDSPLLSRGKSESGKDIIIAQLLRYIEELEHSLGIGKKKLSSPDAAAEERRSLMHIAA